MKYKDLDTFLDEYFIPNHLLYRKTTDDIGNTTYERYINLYNISALRLSDENKNYIIKYLKDRGIVVKGRTNSINFELDDYIDTRNYIGERIPEALTPEETMEKFKLYSETKDPKIREEIILGNMRLVGHILRNMPFDYRLDQYDLLQNGYEGLVRAVDRFDLSKGVTFSTFASSYINGDIRDSIHLQQGVRTTDIPMFRIMKAVEKELGESIIENPSLAEQVVDKVIDEGIRHKKFKKEELRRIMLMNTVSLDEILDNNEDEEFYSLGYEPQDSMSNHLYDEELKESIREEIDKLSDRDKKALAMRFGLCGEETHTFKEIGEEIGMTAFGANLNVKNSCKKLSEEPKVRALKDYSYKEI